MSHPFYVLFGAISRLAWKPPLRRVSQPKRINWWGFLPPLLWAFFEPTPQSCTSLSLYVSNLYIFGTIFWLFCTIYCSVMLVHSFNKFRLHSMIVKCMSGMIISEYCEWHEYQVGWLWVSIESCTIYMIVKYMSWIIMSDYC